MRTLIAVLVLLALLLVGADVATRLIAQQQATRALSAEFDLGADASVQIHGWSFLVQAVRGDYAHITIAAGSAALGPIADAQVQADLYDVRLSLTDALSGTIDRLAADRADIRVTIAQTELATAVGEPGITVTAAGSGTVRVHAAIAVAGATYPVTVDVAASVTDQTLTLVARPVSAAGLDLPAAVADSLQQRLTTSIPLTSLPFPLESATVSAADGMLVISASADSLRLGQLVGGG